MIQQFLEHIWPHDLPFYCLATPETREDGSGTYFAHYVCGTIAEATKKAVWLNSRGKNVFMAVGTLKEKEYTDPKTEKKHKRVHANMDSYQTLIFDIDAGEKKPYKTQGEALKALIDFTNATHLPKPTIVNSGNGLHVYYTLTTVISVDHWYEFSTRLKAIAKHFKLHIDNSRTSDKASVLRVAGTQNWKDPQNPKEVKVASWGEPTDPRRMQVFLKTIIEDNEIKLVEQKVKAVSDIQKMFDGLESNIELPKGDAELIYKQCAQMRRAREVGGPIGYELRGAAISVLKCTVDPDYSVLSANDENEDLVVSQNESMINASLTNNPNTCERFEAFYPEGCEGCPHRGHIKSPASLGRPREGEKLPPPSKPVQDSEPQKVVLDETDGVDFLQEVSEDDTLPIKSLYEPKLTIRTSTGIDMELPDPPFPYKRTQKGLFIEVVDDEGLSTNDKIYQYDIYPYEIIDDVVQGTVFKMVCKMAFGKDKYLEVPFTCLVDQKLFNMTLAKSSIVPASNEQRNMLYGYMSAYINEIQRLCKSTENYPQLGWQKDGDGFILPTKRVLRDGSEEECGVTKGIKTATDNFRKRGTLEGWRKVIDVYGRPGYEPYAFGHLVGYASILFRFTGYAGAMVNMVGDSGSGKSTVLHTINSIFGHPTEPILMQHDTFNARINRLGIFNSVCVTYDEITNIDPEELSTLCYSITQGRGKERLTQNAEVKENNTKWQMIVASSSNANLMGKLASLKHDASAESLRVFEYAINSMNVMSKAEARETFRGLEDNYGHAGEIFLKYVIQNQEEVRSLIDAIMIKFDEAADVPTNERYWSAIVACVLAGGEIARKLGLCEYDIAKLFRWSVNQILLMRGVVKDNRKEPRALLVEFLNIHINNTIVIGGGTDSDKVSYVREEPRSGLMIRTEIDKGVAYVAKADIRRWLSKGGSDYNWVRKMLVDSRIILDDDVNKVLSSGSSVVRTGQSKCWLVDLNHNEMVGSVIVPTGIKKDERVVEMFANVKGG